MNEVIRLLCDAQQNLEANNREKAKRLYERVLKLDPENPIANGNLGEIHWLNSDFKESRTLLERAAVFYERAIIQNVVGDPTLYFGLATVLYTLRRDDDAIALIRSVLAHSHNHLMRHLLAELLLGKGDIRGAFHEREYKPSSYLTGRSLLPPPRWRGERLEAGKTLMIVGETEGFGFGELIQFVRFVPIAAQQAGCRVVLVILPQLMKLFAAIPNVELLPWGASELPGFDCGVPVMSLAHVLGTTLQTIPSKPYVRGDCTAWTPFLSSLSGLKVGLVWAGQSRKNLPQNSMDKRRSMALATMAPLLSVAGCSFVSLQLGTPALQMKTLPKGTVLHDVSNRLNDWQATADLIAGLDLVVTVDTAVAHLTGALGKPVWMLNRWDTDRRWMNDRSDTPWYPSMKIFRQKHIGQWSPVIAEVSDVLAEYARTNVLTDMCSSAA